MISMSPTNDHLVSVQKASIGLLMLADVHGAGLMIVGW